MLIKEDSFKVKGLVLPTANNNKLSESEFNRSSAMQAKYGTYPNYLKGVTQTAGGFTSASASTSRNSKAIDNDLLNSDTKIKSLESQAKQAELEYNSALAKRNGGYSNRTYDSSMDTAVSFAKNKRDSLSNQLNEAYSEKSLLQKERDTAIRQESKTSESEFNRSSAMQTRYGNYDNYLKNRTVNSSGFYSPDEFMTDKDATSWAKTIRSSDDIKKDKVTLNERISNLEAKQKEAERNANGMQKLFLDSFTDTQKSDVAIAKAYSDSLKKQLNELYADRDRLDEEEYYSYIKLGSNADYAEKSKYSTTKNGSVKWIGNTVSDTGFGDVTYDYINRNPDAVAVMDAMSSSDGTKLLGFDKSYLRQMTDDEIKTYNYIYSQDKDKANEYLSTLQKTLTYRQKNARAEDWAKYAEENPVQASAFSTLMSPLKAVSAVSQTLSALGDGVDENAAYNKFADIPSAIRSKVSEKIEEKWGKSGSFLYQTGMSMADFLFNTAITGGNEALSLGLMGSESVPDTVIEAKERGLSDKQAMTLGVISGLAEIVTEKVSIENLFSRQWEENALKYFVKNVIAEGSEEGASDIINTIADVLLTKDKSKWQTSINAYKEKGYDNKKAFLEAFNDQLSEIGLDMLGGALSGGVMAGGSIALNTAINNSNLKAMGSGVDENGLQRLIDVARQSGDTELADELSLRLSNNSKISELDKGRLMASVLESTSKDMSLPRAAEEFERKRMSRSDNITERSGYENNVSTENIKQAGRIGNLFGHTVRFFNEGAVEVNGNKAIKNGYIDGNGDIWINSNSKDIPLQILTHELTHNIEGTDSYKQLSDHIISSLKKSGEYEMMVADRGRFYNESEMDSEIVAKWMQDKGLTSEAEIREAVRSSHSFGTWMVDQFDRLLAKMGNTQAEERTVIRKARRLYTDALREIKNTATNGGVRNSISDITEDSDGNTLSEGQKEYFKDSKVRDEQGNLIKVYHGTDANFTVFDSTKSRANMDIQGMFFSPWEIDAGGYGETKAYYLDIKNPAPEDVGYRALNRFKGQNNAGAKAREYLISLGYDGVNNGGEEYIAFYPNQIKLADNSNPTGNEDIRYSYSSFYDNAESNTEAKDSQTALDDYANMHTEDTTGETDIKSNVITARQDLRTNVRKLFSIPQDAVNDVNLLINTYADMMMDDGFINDTDINTLFDILYESGKVTPDSIENDIRRELKSTKIFVPSNIVDEFGDDWGSWVKRAFAAGLYLTKNNKNIPIDILYRNQLSTQFPGTFSANETDATEMIKKVIEVMEGGKNISLDEYNRYVYESTGVPTEEIVSDMKQKLVKAFSDFLPAAAMESRLRQQSGISNKLSKQRSMIEEQRAQRESEARQNEAERANEAQKLMMPHEVQFNGNAENAEQLFGLYKERDNLTTEPNTEEPGQVATETEKEKKSIKDIADETKSFFMRKFVDSGYAVNKVAKEIKDNALYAYFNAARGNTSAATNMIERAATDIAGNATGESLNDIFDPVRQKGNEYYLAFQRYLYHLHNIDRMSRDREAERVSAQTDIDNFLAKNPRFVGVTEAQVRQWAYESLDQDIVAQEYLDLIEKYRRKMNAVNKPVFDYDVTADDSKLITMDLEQNYPEFKELSQRVYKYIDNLLRYRVDSGLISEDMYNGLKKAYPHYVPTYRITNKENIDTSDMDSVFIGKTVGKAVGANGSKLMPLHKALAQQTLSVTREGSKNRFGIRLLNAGDRAKNYIYDIAQYESSANEDNFDATDDLIKKNNTFVVRDKGKLYEMTVNPELFEAVTALTPSNTESNSIMNFAKGANDLFKALCTGYNPTFVVKNFLRDIQDAGLYSQDTSQFAKEYPIAVKEIATGGEYWRRYQALGGTYSSMFNYETGTTEKGSKLKQLTVNRIEALNEAVEQAPRLAEFMSYVDRHGGLEDATLDTLNKAMLAAADVTVNFGRSGTWGKFINQYLVPFFNPGMQGLSKTIRMFTETKGAKSWLSLAVKAAALGIAPTIINNLVYKDDDEYEMLTDRNKDTYYLLKMGNGTWLKLPKGRVLSVIGATANRAINLVKGEDVNWKDYIEFVGSQTAPADPMNNNIFAAAIKTQLFNKDNPGETWYGTDIESQRLQKYSPENRYDANTDVISKFLGQTFKLSPKKINYLLNQYTGVAGDIILPLLTPAADKSFISSAFTIDSAQSNKLQTEYYDKLDELTYKHNDVNGTDADDVMYKWWNKQSDSVSEINRAIREIESDESLSDSDKRELLNVQYNFRNETLKDALDKYDAYEDAVNKYIDSGADNAYIYANRDLYGAEYALSVYSKAKYEKAQKANQSGVSYDDQLELYMKMDDIVDASVLDKQKVITSSSMNDKNKLTMLQSVTSESEYNKISVAYNAGVSPSKYVTMKSLYPKDSPSQDEVESILNTMVLSNNERAILWQCANKSWAAKNNPYNTSLSAQIRSKLNGTTSSNGLTLPGNGLTLPGNSGGLTLPGNSSSGLTLPGNSSGGLTLPSKSGGLTLPG